MRMTLRYHCQHDVKEKTFSLGRGLCNPRKNSMVAIELILLLLVSTCCSKIINIADDARCGFLLIDYKQIKC